MKNTHIRQTKTSISATRVGWIALIVVAVLLISSVAYAFSPTLRNLIQMDVGLNEVESAGLGHSLNISQTNEDITVTLVWGYADENRVAVGYIIEAGANEPYEPQQLTLTDQAGREFNSIAGLGATDNSAVLGVSVPPGESDYLFSFATPPISSRPETLDLNLEFVLATRDGLEVTQPFNFSFTLPYTPGRVVESRQSVSFDDITLSLEKVVVTPSDLTAVICFDPPNDEFEKWLPISEISVDGNEELMATVGTQRKIEGTNCTTNGYFPSLYEAEGTWQLTVTELVGFKMSESTSGVNSGPEQIRPQGPWVFEFEMP